MPTLHLDSSLLASSSHVPPSSHDEQPTAPRSRSRGMESRGNLEDDDRYAFDSESSTEEDFSVHNMARKEMMLSSSSSGSNKSRARSRWRKVLSAGEAELTHNVQSGSKSGAVTHITSSSLNAERRHTSKRGTHWPSRQQLRSFQDGTTAVPASVATIALERAGSDSPTESPVAQQTGLHNEEKTPGKLVKLEIPTGDQDAEVVNSGTPISIRRKLMNSMKRRMGRDKGQSQSPNNMGVNAMDKNVKEKLFGAFQRQMQSRHSRGHRPWYTRTIPETGKLRSVWDPIMAVLILYTAIMVPFFLGFETFQEHVVVDAIDLIVDCLFIIDIFFNFRTQYIDSDTGKLVKNGKKIAKNYLLGLFVVDIVASIPLDRIVGAIAEGEAGTAEQSDILLRIPKMMKILRILRLAKLLRVSRLFRASEVFQVNYNISSSLMRITKLVFVIIFFSHWSACLWFFISRLEDFPSNSWVKQVDIDGQPLDLQPVSVQYLICIYNAVSMMITLGLYQGIYPETQLEILFTIGIMIVSATFYAILIASLSSLMVNMDPSGSEYKQSLDDMNNYMAYRKIPRSLRRRVNDYYDTKFSRKKVFDENAILSRLSLPLRKEVLRHVVQDLMRKVPFFQQQVFITVKGARGLTAADLSGTSDPYAVVKFGEASQHTKVIEKTLNPEWDASFTFDLSILNGERINISVFDKDNFSQDDFLGQVEIPLENVPTSKVLDSWFTLCPRPNGTEEVSGQIHIQTNRWQADNGFVSSIITELIPDPAGKGDYIFLAGEMAEDLYFIAHGNLEIISTTGSVVTNLTDGSYIGEAESLFETKRVVTARATTFCELYRIPYTTLAKILESYPDVGLVLKAVALRRMRKWNIPMSNLEPSRLALIIDEHWKSTEENQAPLEPPSPQDSALGPQSMHATHSFVHTGTSSQVKPPNALSNPQSGVFHRRPFFEAPHGANPHELSSDDGSGSEDDVNMGAWTAPAPRYTYDDNARMQELGTVAKPWASKPQTISQNDNVPPSNNHFVHVNGSRGRSSGSSVNIYGSPPDSSSADMLM